MKPCCHRFTDNVTELDCSGVGKKILVGGAYHHHSGLTCDSVRYLYNTNLPEVNTTCQELYELFSGLLEDSITSQKQEESIYTSQLSEIVSQKSVIDKNLLQLLAQIESLQLSLSSTIERSEDYEYKLIQMKTITIAEAQDIVESLPFYIQSQKLLRVDRKKRRESELKLLDKIKGIVHDLTGFHISPSNSTQSHSNSKIKCYHFEREGYYYHSEQRSQLTEILCDSNTNCAIQKILLNPLSDPATYIVKMGCYNQLVPNAQGCGITSYTTCPSENHMFLVECCQGNLCNNPEGSIGSTVYKPSQCDPISCACKSDEIKFPSPYPSSSPFPSPSISTSSSYSSSISLSATASKSLTSSPSPSVSAFPISCDAIKSENRNAESGIYTLTLGAIDYETHQIYCDMEVDSSVGYSLVWKNVGGNFDPKLTSSPIKSNEDLIRGGENDLVTPSSIRYSNQTNTSLFDGSQFNTKAFHFYSTKRYTEWVKMMTLYNGKDQIQTQYVKIVMNNITMDEVIDLEDSGKCINFESGSFSLYTSSRLGDKNELDYFMGETSIIDKTSTENSIGFPTSHNSKCGFEISQPNLISDTSKLRYLNDHLNLGSNDGWKSIENIFSFSPESTNSRDYSKCMFRCWNGREGQFHETFVWGAKVGCPGFIFSTQQRCSGHGICEKGKCICENGWTGEDCSAKHILSTQTKEFQNGKEVCEGNKCVLQCNEGYVPDGPNSWECSSEIEKKEIQVSKCVPFCIANCSGNGVCVEPYQCVCNHGFVGESCAERTCRTAIQKVRHGKISCYNKETENYVCTLMCENQYEVSGEETVSCRNGTWKNIGQCVPSCLPHRCSNHGKCIQPGKCQCESGYRGDKCELSDCPDVNQCSDNGVCVSTNVCLCHKGWDGPRCDLSIRELNDVALYLSADGTQKIDLPYLGEFNSTAIEFWMFPEHVLGKQFIYDATNKSIPGQLSIGLVHNQLFVQIEEIKTINFEYKFFGGLWTHIAVTISQNQITLYVNGVRVETKPLSLTHQIVLGAHRLGGLQPYQYKGYLKELRIWKNSRKSEKIKENTFVSLTGVDKQLVSLFPLSGPLSANTFYIEDLTGGYGSRVLNAKWKRSPFAPPTSPQLLPTKNIL